MSETTTTSVWDTALPIEFRVEAFYAQNPTALTQWHRTEWSKFFEKMPLAQRIELCDEIWKKEDVLLTKVAAYLANGIMRCGNSKHVRWESVLRKEGYDDYNHTTYEIGPNKLYRDGFWRGIEKHLQAEKSDATHSELWQATEEIRKIMWKEQFRSYTFETADLDKLL
jgi:hypothetical protein